MADPYVLIDSTGIIVANTADVQAQVIAEFQAALGTDLNPDPSTPQGLLITGETAARSRVMQNNAALANQINPNYAGGVFLDSVCALTGLQRQVSTPSLIQGVTITGVPGATIPAGSRASVGAGGALFAIITTTVLPPSGTTTADFQSVENGAIACGIGALNTIVDGVLGWETVSNSSEAILGTLTQSDQSLRQLRRNTLALQNAGISESIISGLYAVNGVKSLSFLENTAATTQTISGRSLVAHSIRVCVQGGTDSDVANSLLSNKDGGCAWNGSTTVTVVDPWSGQSYDVEFDRPSEVTIKVRATIKVIGANADPTTAVTNAVLAFAANTINGLSGYAVGQSVSPFEIAAAIMEQTTGLYVKEVEISNDGGTTWYTTQISIAINELAVTGSGDISVVIL